LSFSPAIEKDFAAIAFRTDREVNPISGAALLKDDLAATALTAQR
jgi:hypothetical protein